MSGLPPVPQITSPSFLAASNSSASRPLVALPPLTAGLATALAAPLAAGLAAAAPDEGPAAALDGALAGAAAPPHAASSAAPAIVVPSSRDCRSISRRLRAALILLTKTDYSS